VGEIFYRGISAYYGEAMRASGIGRQMRTDFSAPQRPSSDDTLEPWATLYFGGGG
jgi:hypothetical protein